MRRLKEGFYNIMKLADAVKAKGQEAKAELIQYSQENKLEKPITEAIIRFKTTLEEDKVVDIQIGEDDTKLAKGGKKKKKASGGGPSTLFKKKLQLKLGAGEGNGDKEESKEEKKAEESKKEVEETIIVYNVNEPEHKLEENKASVKIVEEVQPVEEKIEVRVELKEEMKVETPKEIVKIEDIQILKEEISTKANQNQSQADLQNRVEEVSTINLREIFYENQTIPIRRFTSLEQSAILLISRLNQVFIQNNLRSAFTNFKSQLPNNKLITKIVKLRESFWRASMRSAFDQIRRVGFSKNKQGSGQREEGKLRLIHWIIKMEKANRSNISMRAIAFLKWKQLISSENHAAQKEELKLSSETIGVLKRSDVLNEQLHPFLASASLHRVFMTLDQSLQRSKHQAFSLIKSAITDPSQTYLTQIRQTLEILEDHLNAIQQTPTNTQLLKGKPKSQSSNQVISENLDCVQTLKKTLQDSKNMYRLYKQVWEHNNSSQSTYKIENSDLKLQSANKISAILHKRQYVDKALLRRLRIWQSNRLRDEMKILCQSLQTIGQKDQRVRVISVLQNQRIAMQSAFYKWVAMVPNQISDKRTINRSRIVSVQQTINNSQNQSGTPNLNLIVLNPSSSTSLGRVRSKTALNMASLPTKGSQKHGLGSASMQMNIMGGSSVYYGNLNTIQQNTNHASGIGKSTLNHLNQISAHGSRQQIQSSNSSHNINQSGHGRRQHYDGSGSHSSSSLDEIGLMMMHNTSTGSMKPKSGTRASGGGGHGNKRPQQKVSMMGSFDFDQQIQLRKAQQSSHNTSQNQIGGTHHQSKSSKTRLNQQQKVIISQQQSQNQYLNQALYTISGMNTTLNTQTGKRELLRLAYILMRSKNRSTVQSHIDKLTQISKQSLRHRKLAQSVNNPSSLASTNSAKSTFFTEEIQMFINSSCRLITGNFFKKWVDFAIDQGKRQIVREKAITQMFRGIERHVKANKFEGILKLYKYKQMVQRNSGSIKQRTLLSFKLSQMKVALTLVHLIHKKSQKSALFRSFKHWSLHSASHNLKLRLNSDQKYASNLDSKISCSQVAKLVQSSRIRTGTFLITRAFQKVSQPKYDLKRFFNLWNSQIHSPKHFFLLSLLKKLTHRNLTVIGKKFLQWKTHYLETLRLESMTYNSIKASPEHVTLNPKDMHSLIQIDEGLIQVQAESAVALENRLDKQIAIERKNKLNRLIEGLITHYENKKDRRPMIMMRRALHWWANAASTRMNFGRISKYLYEIDISNEEKRELEQKIAQVNEDNEAMQQRIHEHTINTECDQCRNIQMNKALMAAQLQTERRQEVWEQYGNQYQQANDEDFESEVQRIGTKGTPQENYMEEIRLVQGSGSSNDGDMKEGNQRSQPYLSRDPSNIVHIHSNRVRDLQHLGSNSSLSSNEKDFIQNDQFYSQKDLLIQKNSQSLSRDLSSLAMIKDQSIPSFVEINRGQGKISQKRISRIQVDESEDSNFFQSDYMRNESQVHLNGQFNNPYFRDEEEEFKHLQNVGSESNIKQAAFGQLYRPQKQIVKSGSQFSIISSIYGGNQPLQPGTSSGGSTQMQRISSYNSIGNSKTHIRRSDNQTSSNPDGTVIEELDAEQFGNDLVFELEQDNQRLRQREEELKRAIAYKLAQQQQRREQLLNRLRMLEQIKHEEGLVTNSEIIA